MTYKSYMSCQNDQRNITTDSCLEIKIEGEREFKNANILSNDESWILSQLLFNVM